MENAGGNVMRSQRRKQAKNARKFSHAVIAKRYLDLQKLRDEVRKAETKRGMHILHFENTTRRALRSD